MSEEREDRGAGATQKEDVSDQGRSVFTWVLIEDIARSLKHDVDGLSVLDNYQEKNPSKHWERGRPRWLQRGAH